ncbi:hypothetical protein WAI453_002898 [Rhynchosporium graminicola]
MTSILSSIINIAHVGIDTRYHLPSSRPEFSQYFQVVHPAFGFRRRPDQDTYFNVAEFFPRLDFSRILLI